MVVMIWLNFELSSANPISIIDVLGSVANVGGGVGSNEMGREASCLFSDGPDAGRVYTVRRGFGSDCIADTIITVLRGCECFSSSLSDRWYRTSSNVFCPQIQGELQLSISMWIWTVMKYYRHASTDNFKNTKEEGSYHESSYVSRQLLPGWQSCT